jgi:hypothetical protein
VKVSHDSSDAAMIKFVSDCLEAEEHQAEATLAAIAENRQLLNAYQQALSSPDSGEAHLRWRDCLRLAVRAMTDSYRDHPDCAPAWPVDPPPPGGASTVIIQDLQSVPDAVVAYRAAADDHLRAMVEAATARERIRAAEDYLQRLGSGDARHRGPSSARPDRRNLAPRGRPR